MISKEQRPRAGRIWGWIAAFGAAALLAFSGCAAPGGGPWEAVVYLGSQEYAVIPIGEPGTVTIDQGDGKVNRVAVTEEGVFMEEATCPNGDCVAQGLVAPEDAGTRALGAWIICLPHEVSVELREAAP